ncbi:hypothetical protein FOA20_19190 [Peribacillus simplex]
MTTADLALGFHSPPPIKIIAYLPMIAGKAPLGESRKASAQVPINVFLNKIIAEQSPAESQPGFEQSFH